MDIVTISQYAYYGLRKKYRSRKLLLGKEMTTVMTSAPESQNEAPSERLLVHISTPDNNTKLSSYLILGLLACMLMISASSMTYTPNEIPNKLHLSKRKLLQAVGLWIFMFY